MKYLIFVLIFALSGCGSLLTNQYFNSKKLLDTAPKESGDVMYPEWGDGENVTETDSLVQSVQTQPQSSPNRQIDYSTLGTLTQYLSAQNIEYEVLQGNFPVVRIKRIIRFDTGSDKVSYDSRAWIYKISDFLSGKNNIEVIVDGHADNTGGDGLNDNLSRRRATAVKALLVDAPNVYTNSIYTRGFSSAVPLCGTSNTKSSSCNRRVEIFFIVTS
ncbi:OmpA family protein [Vibrio sp.]|nr:OmpA family protein [Vibrio sp.]